jgi:hypothetical protein
MRKNSEDWPNTTTNDLIERVNNNPKGPHASVTEETKMHYNYKGPTEREAEKRRIESYIKSRSL